MTDPESSANSGRPTNRRLSRPVFWAFAVFGLGLLILVWIPPIFSLLGDYRRSESDPIILVTHFVMLAVAIYVTVSGFRFIRRYRPE